MRRRHRRRRSRGSGATAIRSARANALNTVSGLVMGVLAAQVVDVQRDERVIDEALEELVREVDVERADHRARERHVELEARPAREIDHDARQRLVERHVRVAVAGEPLLVAERLRHRLAERDADVLDRVVRVDVQDRPWRAP